MPSGTQLDVARRLRLSLEQGPSGRASSEHAAQMVGSEASSTNEDYKARSPSRPADEVPAGVPDELLFGAGGRRADTGRQHHVLAGWRGGGPGRAARWAAPPGRADPRPR